MRRSSSVRRNTRRNRSVKRNTRRNRSVKRNNRRSNRRITRRNNNRNQRRVNGRSSRKRVSRKNSRRRQTNRNQMRIKRRGNRKNRKKKLTFSGGASWTETEMIIYLNGQYNPASAIIGVNHQPKTPKLVSFVFKSVLNQSDKWINKLPKGPSTSGSGEWLDITKATHLILHNGTEWVCACYGYSDNWDNGSGWYIYGSGDSPVIDNYVTELNK